MAKGPIVEAEALREDPWTGTSSPYPCLALTLALTLAPTLALTLALTLYLSPHEEVRWVVDGFNENRKTNFRPGWGKPRPSPYPYPYPYPFSHPNPSPALALHD